MREVKKDLIKKIKNKINNASMSKDTKKFMIKIIDYESIHDFKDINLFRNDYHSILNDCIPLEEESHDNT